MENIFDLVAPLSYLIHNKTEGRAILNSAVYGYEAQILTSRFSCAEPNSLFESMQLQQDRR